MVETLYYCNLLCYVKCCHHYWHSAAYMAGTIAGQCNVWTMQAVGCLNQEGLCQIQNQSWTGFCIFMVMYTVWMTKCDNTVTVTGHGVVCTVPIGCWELARQAEAVVWELTSSCFSWKHISWHVCMRVYVSGMRGRVSRQVNISMERKVSS